MARYKTTMTHFTIMIILMNENDLYKQGIFVLSCQEACLINPKYKKISEHELNLLNANEYIGVTSDLNQISYQYVCVIQMKINLCKSNISNERGLSTTV